MKMSMTEPQKNSICIRFLLRLRGAFVSSCSLCAILLLILFPAFPIKLYIFSWLGIIFHSYEYEKPVSVNDLS